MPPTSVAGGLANDRSTSRSAGCCGPGSALGSADELMAPCSGLSGFPNSAALILLEEFSLFGTDSGSTQERLHGW